MPQCREKVALMNFNDGLEDNCFVNTLAVVEIMPVKT